MWPFPGLISILWILHNFAGISCNHRGHRSEDNRLAVQLPVFTEPVPNVTVTAGRDAQLPCVVDHLGHFKVAWVRVDTETILTIHTKIISRNPRVSLSQNAHRQWFLKLKNVEENDRGWYMCQVNTVPMRSSTGYLEVLVPPRIEAQDSSGEIVAREGSNVSLGCKTSGHPPPTITWRREDGIEFLHNGVSVSVVEGSTLHLSKVSRLHMGAYLCISSNGVPPSVSHRMILKVQFPPMLWIPSQLEGAYIGQGHVMLECHVEAYPKAIHYWTNAKGDMILSGDKHESVMADDAYRVYMRLKIRSVTESDFGTYKCVAKNSLGETDGTIKLYEIAAPSTIPTSTTALSTVFKHSDTKHGKSKKGYKKKLRNWKDTSQEGRNDVYDEDDSLGGKDNNGGILTVEDTEFTLAPRGTSPVNGGGVPPLARPLPTTRPSQLPNFAAGCVPHSSLICISCYLTFRVLFLS